MRTNTWLVRVCGLARPGETGFELLFEGSRHGGLRRRRPTDCRAGPRRARVQVNESGKFVLDGSKRGTPLRPPECTPEKFNQYIADVFRFYECAPHPVPRGQALALH